MDIEEWWEKLSKPTQDWLLEHAGETLTSEVAEEISVAGGIVTTEPSDDEEGPAEFLLTDEAVDWIEELANEEH